MNVKTKYHDIKPHVTKTIKKTNKQTNKNRISDQSGDIKLKSPL